MKSLSNVFRGALLSAMVSCTIACRLLGQVGSDRGHAGVVEKAKQVQTASTHPMKFQVSLPRNWTPDQSWPVLIVPSAHFPNRAKTLELFTAERDAKQRDFIVVLPWVINSDPVDGMKEYEGEVMKSIKAADAADGFRDDGARARFDSAGIIAVIKDVKDRYHGEERVYLTGFSASTHVAYLFLFNHPELLKGVFINSGVYLGRGVDEDRIPLQNSPERARLPIKFTIGSNDPGYPNGSANWEDVKRKLLSYGHPASRIQFEVVKKDNPEHMSAGHNWFPTKIFEFCAAAELSNQK